MEILSFTRNKFDIEVVKCCGSCTHKCFKDGNHPRWCKEKDEKVETYGVCGKWQMREALNMAGCSEGRVKRSGYLKFVYRLRINEQMAIERGEMKVSGQKPISIVRAEYKKFFGISPFMGK